MTTKHTPGEWYVDAERRNHAEDKRTGRFSFTVCARDAEDEVPWVLASVESDSPDNEANARLMAAAPALAAACEAALAYVRATLNGRRPDLSSIELAGILGAALHKVVQP
jgi:hypothetical protein